MSGFPHGGSADLSGDTRPVSGPRLDMLLDMAERWHVGYITSARQAVRLALASDKPNSTSRAFWTIAEEAYGQAERVIVAIRAAGDEARAQRLADELPTLLVERALARRAGAGDA